MFENYLKGIFYIWHRFDKKKYFSNSFQTFKKPVNVNSTEGFNRAIFLWRQISGISRYMLNQHAYYIMIHDIIIPFVYILYFFKNWIIFIFLLNCILFMEFDSPSIVKESYLYKTPPIFLHDMLIIKTFSNSSYIFILYNMDCFGYISLIHSSRVYSLSNCHAIVRVFKKYL